MKKILFMVLCCLFLCGCEKDFQASNFKWEKRGSSSFSLGSIKNNSSEKCNHLRIELLYTNGDIKENSSCLPLNDEINLGETIDVECIYTGTTKNITDYDIKVVTVECMDYLYS